MLADEVAFVIGVDTPPTLTPSRLSKRQPSARAAS